MAPLPAHLNVDTIPVVLNKQLGTPLKGDAELHLLAGMPFRFVDSQVPTHAPSAVLANAQKAGLSLADATTLSNEMAKRIAGTKHD